MGLLKLVKVVDLINLLAAFCLPAGFVGGVWIYNAENLFLIMWGSDDELVEATNCLGRREPKTLEFFIALAFEIGWNSDVHLLRDLHRCSVRMFRDNVAIQYSITPRIFFLGGG